MAEDDKTTEEVVKGIAKSVQDSLTKFDERMTTVEKACEDIKKMAYGDKKKDDDDDDKKKDVKKDIPAVVSEPDKGPETVTKEFMKELLEKTFPDMVSEEVKKTLAGTGTSQSDKPGTGAVSVKTEEVKKDEETPALQETVVGQDLIEIAKSGGKKKGSKMTHPSKGMAPHDQNGVPQYA